MNIDILLAQISEISKKYNVVAQKTGRLFNIFAIAGIDSDEVIICRVLYELLNPQGSHFQGFTYFKIFAENVLHLDCNDSDYQAVKVYKEYLTENNRRIDLAIEIADKFIPIEVKIYAGEQHSQCYDYFQNSKNSNLFYLTLYGTPPSEYSAHGLTKEGEGYREVTQISFKEDILFWLEECLRIPDTIKIAPIREVLLQFIAVIRRLTNQMEQNQEAEIVERLTSSTENIKSAFEIENCLKSCKIKMIKKIFKAIEKQINKEKLVNSHDYQYDNYRLINNYYDKKGSTYPSINYFCGALNKPGVDLWLRIELDYRLCVGFCTPLNGENHGTQMNNEEIKAILPTIEPYVDNWWLYWELIPRDDVSVSPNFKEFDETYFDLFDNEKFDLFVNECVKAINNLWSQLNM